MPRGGAREGAGRKAGSVNKASAEALEAAKESGETPLEYMLRVMRDSTAEGPRRDDMAKAAAPYLHPKLASIEHSGPNGGPIEHRMRAAKGELAGKLARLGPEASS